MAFLLDDAAFGGQLMVGAGQPVAIGVGAKEKIRGSAFVEAPMQVGKAGAFNSAEATLMVGQTDNVDCNSPNRSLYVKGDVKIDGDQRSGVNVLVIDGDVLVNGDVDCGNKGALADILSGKVTTLSVKEISAMYSLTISMCYELKDALENQKVNNKKFHEMADNFFTYIMANFETELVVMGAKIALKTYKLPIEPSQLKHFDDFHKKYGKYIVDAGN